MRNPKETQHSAPAAIVHPGIAAPVDPNASGKAFPPAACGGRFLWEPHKAPQGPVSILVSGPDRRMYVYRNGVLIGEQQGTLSPHAVEELA